MAAGYCSGALFLLEPARRRRVLLASGAALIVAFLLLRTLNLYGDPAPWSGQPFLFQPLPSMGGPRELLPPDFGYPLWVVYVVWIGLVALLFPLCRWFAAIKARRSEWWLSYL
jgi:hypothetical protein